MNAEPPINTRFLFDWARLRDISPLRYLAAIVIAVLCHVLCFYLFQVESPRAGNAPPLASSVSLIPRQPEYQALLQRIEDRTSTLSSLFSADSPLHVSPPLPAPKPAFSEFQPQLLPYPEEPSAAIAPKSTAAPIGVLPAFPAPPSSAKIEINPAHWAITTGFPGRTVLHSPIPAAAQPRPESGTANFLASVSREGRVEQVFPLDLSLPAAVAALSGLARQVTLSPVESAEPAWGVLSLRW